MALLAGGDVLALLLFSAIGRFNHGFSVFDFDTLRTADPFIAGILMFLCVLFLNSMDCAESFGIVLRMCVELELNMDHLLISPGEH